MCYTACYNLYLFQFRRGCATQLVTIFICFSSDIVGELHSLLQSLFVSVQTLWVCYTACYNLYLFQFRLGCATQLVTIFICFSSDIVGELHSLLQSLFVSVQTLWVCYTACYNLYLFQFRHCGCATQLVTIFICFSSDLGVLHSLLQSLFVSVQTLWVSYTACYNLYLFLFRHCGCATQLVTIFICFSSDIVGELHSSLQSLHSFVSVQTLWVCYTACYNLYLFQFRRGCATQLVTIFICFSSDIVGELHSLLQSYLFLFRHCGCATQLVTIFICFSSDIVGELHSLLQSLFVSVQTLWVSYTACYNLFLFRHCGCATQLVTIFICFSSDIVGVLHTCSLLQALFVSVQTSLSYRIR